MNSGIAALEQSYQFIFTGVLIVLAIMLFFCLLRACLGPTVADRLVSVNMMGTIVIVMIAVLAIVKDEGYLVDISLIYAMMSFLAVIVLSKVIIGIYNKKSHEQDERTNESRMQQDEPTNEKHSQQETNPAAYVKTQSKTQARTEGIKVENMKKGEE